VSTAQSTDVATRFLEALGSRDFDALAATFADDAVLRGLVPGRLREEHGSAAVAERFRFWFGDTPEFALVDSSVEELADVVRIRWRVTGVDPELGRTVAEQTAYAELARGGIAWMNLVCSGDRLLPA